MCSLEMESMFAKRGSRDFGFFGGDIGDDGDV